MPEILRTRDVVALFKGDAYPVMVPTAENNGHITLQTSI